MADGHHLNKKLSCRWQTRATSCITTNGKILKQSRDHNHTFYPRGASSARVIAMIECLSVCVSHADIVSKRLNIGSRKQHHVIAQGLYFSDAKTRWWTTPLPPEICAQCDPPPFQTAQFRPIFVHCASTVRASEKRSISANRKSTTRFPTSHIDEPCTLPLTPPKGGTKRDFAIFFQ